MTEKKLKKAKELESEMQRLNAEIELIYDYTGYRCWRRKLLKKRKPKFWNIVNKKDKKKWTKSKNKALLRD